jgi:outer membrane protein assembly factor BamB
MRMLTAAVAACLMMACAAWGEDWPQWRGPNRDGKSGETGLLRSWPEGGPELVWAAEGLGEGYSSVAVVGGRVYTTGMNGAKREELTALGADGKRLWSAEYGKAWTRSWAGAKSTPTVVGERLYVVSTTGEVACLDAGKGEVVWASDPGRDYEPMVKPWGTAESPLVTGGKVIFTCGGRKASVLALDARDGKVVWASKALGDKRAFCSPIAVERGDGGVAVVGATGNYIWAVDSADGSVLWTFAYTDKYGGGRRATDNNTNTPIWSEGHVYVTSGYDKGGVKLRPGADWRSVEEVWHDPVLDSHHGHAVLAGGFLYGATWINNRKGTWACVDWRTGKARWEEAWETKGCVIWAEGMLYCLEEKGGRLALVEASPEGWKERGSFVLPKGKGMAWAHPAISGGRLYARRGDALMVYDVKAR